jgi:hypothetical protein
MKSMKVTIKGTCPLLINRFALQKKEVVKKKDQQYIPEEEAQEKSYYDKDVGYYVPSTQIEACMREAAKNFKQGKSNYKNTILSSVFVEEEKLPLGRKFDEIDQRFSRIQRQGIVRSRPRWNTWQLSFTINYDEERIKEDVILQILEEGGAIKAIGDYRPKFGRFKLMK